MMSPRESGHYISSKSQHVQIEPQGVDLCAKELANRINNGQLSIDNLFKKNSSFDNFEDTVGWVFFADTLNFSFWNVEGTEPQYLVTHQGTTYTGYLSMTAAMKRTLAGPEPNLLDPKVFKDITEEQLNQYLMGDNDVPCPMIKERVANLKEVAEVLLTKYDGSFVNCIKKCDKSAVKLLQIITDDFPCFRDVAQFDGQPVQIMKRAQILISDIWGTFRGQGLGEFKDIDQLTMFADYRVPQSLQYFGALKYSDELIKVLESDELLKNGSRYEVEIRGCSIAAVDQVVAKAKEILPDPSKVNDVLADYFLWAFRREKVEEMKKFPYHKVRSIYY